MSVLRIVIIFIIPLISIAVTVAIALIKGKKTQISSSDIFISVLPIIIGAVIAFFAAFLTGIPIGPMLLLAVISIVISAVLLNSKLANGKSSSGSQNVTATATAVSKRYDFKDGNISYCVTFNVDGKGLTELSLPLSQFQPINVGDSGVLTCRDDVFVSFENTRIK